MRTDVMSDAFRVEVARRGRGASLVREDMHGRGARATIGGRVRALTTSAIVCLWITAIIPTYLVAQDAGSPRATSVDTGIPPAIWDDLAIDFGVVQESVPRPTLTNVTRPRTVELLIDALKQAQGPRRTRLLAEVAGCKLPAALPPVSAALADPDPLFRRQAVRSAGVLADASLRDAVAKFLADPDVDLRREALLAAYAIDVAADASAGSPAVTAALADANAPAPVMSAALRRAAPGDAAAIAALLSKLSKNLRPEAVRALGRLKASAHAGAVAALLVDEDVALRSASLAALRQMGVAEQVDSVSKFLDHAHPTIRREALATHGWLAPVADRQARALSALKDPDPSVRLTAVEILERHPTVDAVPALFAFLADPHPAMHAAARNALAKPASPAMRELVSDRAAALLDHAESVRRIDGSFLLGRLRSDKNVARHLSFLQIKEPPHANDLPLMTQAAESLGQIGVKEAGPLVAAITRTAPTTVLAINPKTFLSDDASVAAFVAGGKLGEPGVLPEANRLLGVAGGQPTELRAAATFAFGAATTDPADAATNAALLKMTANEYESGLSRYEAIKALVRRNVPGTLELVTRLSTTSTDPYARFAAHWAAERLSGQPRPYTPPTRPWVATTSISDLVPGE